MSGETSRESGPVWKRTRHFIAGYFSGAALVLAGHPFDTIKVRMQSQGRGGRFAGPLHCLRATIAEEGVMAVYKGVTPPLFATGVINSILFGLQGMAVAAVAANADKPELSEVCLAAVISGAGISVLVAPMEGVKARLQVQYESVKSGGQPRYAGPVDCVKQVVRELGVRNGLYRGWLPTALCRMSNYAYFGSYELISRVLTPDGASRKERSLGTSVLAGGLTGFGYWFSCYPLDVVKNRIMASPDQQPPVYRNMRHAFATIYRAEGLAGFTTGLVPCLLRAFPANAACFLAFEAMMRILPE